MTKQTELSTISLLICIAIGLIVLLYHTYLIWFFPEKYTGDLIRGTPDWWPFSDFYKKWFASKPFLWLFRISYSIMLLLLLFLFFITLLGIAGFFP